MLASIFDHPDLETRLAQVACCGEAADIGGDPTNDRTLHTRRSQRLHKRGLLGSDRICFSIPVETLAPNGMESMSVQTR